MKTIRKSVSINKSLDQVYDFLTQPENLPQIWPSMIEVSNVHLKPDGAHSFDWVYKMAGMRFKGHADTTEVEKNKRVVVKNVTGIPSTFTWTYAGENGGTRVTLAVEYTIPVPLLDKLIEPIIHRLNEHEAEIMLNNLKARLELETRPTAKVEHRPPPR